MSTYCRPAHQLLNLAAPVSVLKQLEWEAQSADSPPTQDSASEAESTSTLEPFPEYTEDYYEEYAEYYGQDDEDDFRGVFDIHCILHCQRITCCRIYHQQKRAFPPPECTCEVQGRPVARGLSSISRLTIKAMSMQDLQRSRRVLRLSNEKETVTISRTSWKPLIQQLLSMGVLDLGEYLHESLDFKQLPITKLTHADAAKDAAKLIGKILKYFHMMSFGAPPLHKTLFIKKMEMEMLVCLRWDVMAFLSEWIWEGRDLKTLTWNHLREAIAKNAGVRDLWKAAVDCVKDMVAVCIWWSQQRGW